MTSHIRGFWHSMQTPVSARTLECDLERRWQLLNIHCSLHCSYIRYFVILELNSYTAAVNSIVTDRSLNHHATLKDLLSSFLLSARVVQKTPCSENGVNDPFIRISAVLNIAQLANDNRTVHGQISTTFSKAYTFLLPLTASWVRLMYIWRINNK